MRTRPATCIWATAAASLLALETYGVKRPGAGHTLSEVTRATFRTDTIAGSVSFVAAWAALTVWFVPHILCPRPGPRA
jgi:hypothetical protein